MEVLHGKSVSNLIAIGNIYYYKKNMPEIKRIDIQSSEVELDRFYDAKNQAKKDLNQLYEKAVTEIGAGNAMIFDTHILMLDDPEYLENVENIIKSQKVNAEYAIMETCNHFVTLFSSMDDEYMKERAIDIRDISDRLIQILSGNLKAEAITSPVILVAEDLLPSETIQIDQTKLLGIVTKNGSKTSHTAILAKTMGIPALFGIDIDPNWHEKQAIIDGHSETLIVSPDADTIKKMVDMKKLDENKQDLLQSLIGKETITIMGQKVNLFANIGNLSDLSLAIDNDAEGIGLFRTEFLYLEKDHFPTEEQQFQVYKETCEKMDGKKVIIRTLDIGADKAAPYFKLKNEANPALGYRGIRVCLKNPDILKTQLRAIYRASIYGKISVMFPMIISISEMKRIKRIIKEVKEELNSQQIPFKEIEIGIMIETPAAVMISDLLAQEVDFFSIGTNDLSQYTLAIDRLNPELEEFFDEGHEAILRMIRLVVENGHKNGIKVGICGELATNVSLLAMFLDIQIDELSVSPTCILPIRNSIRNFE